MDKHYKHYYCGCMRKLLDMARCKQIRVAVALIALFAGLIIYFVTCAVSDLCSWVREFLKTAYDETNTLLYDAWHWDKLPEYGPSTLGRKNYGRGKEKAAQ